MAQVTLEYMILIPVLILQIFIFPFTASVIMDSWTSSRVNMQLQEVTSHLGSSIQQLYYTINHASIATGSLTLNMDAPLAIQDGNKIFYYNITIRNATSNNNYAKVLNLTLSFINAQGSASTLITLGENIAWQDNLTFRRETVSYINATKVNTAIWLSFGGTP
jgi:hypothetical protein